ncbi:MAG: shikimate kinase [Longimicrobiales bacterium]
MTESESIRRILLVGFMGSGKTLVGRALARRLGWSFRDFDQEVRVRVGLPIPEIFRQHGEAGFRQVEAAVGAELLREENVVLASGGGWAAEEGRVEQVPPGTLTVWLKVTPEEAVRRVRKEGPTRPLLAVPDPLARARELLGAREAWYQRADLALDSHDGDPEEMARRIEEILITTGRRTTPPTSA